MTGRIVVKGDPAPLPLTFHALRSVRGEPVTYFYAVPAGGEAAYKEAVADQAALFHCRSERIEPDEVAAVNIGGPGGVSVVAILWEGEWRVALNGGTNYPAFDPALPY